MLRALLFAVLLAAAPAWAQHDLSGETTAIVPRYLLQDPLGRSVTSEDFRGRFQLISFGYTYCRDVCPTTLVELAAVKKQLGADGERVQVVFITVDPERDTPELLKAYVENFDKGFVALRGTAEQTQAVAKEFKVYYAKVPGKTEGSYTMDHTAASYLFDAQGRVRVFSRYGSGAQALADDLKALLADKS